MKLKIKNYLNLKSSIYLFIQKYYFFILPIIIIFSSLKIFGYVFFFFLCFPYIFQKRNKIILTIKESDYNQKFVLFYFLFLILEVIFGAYYLKDIRVLIFWIPLFLTALGIYFKNIYDLKSNIFYRANYIRIIFISSLTYFIFYFFLNILAYIFSDGFYSIQDNFWIGSSSAFSISSLLLISLYELWGEKNFKIFSYYTATLMFYIFVVLMNETRLGIVYIVSITIFLFLRNIQLKKYFNSILILLIVSFTYTFSAFALGEFQNFFKYQKKLTIHNHINRTIIEDSTKIFKSDDSRSKELFLGYSKFKEYPIINKLIGTGWYTGRVTRNLNSEELGNYNLNHINKEPHSLQGIISLLFDSGILGMFLLVKMYLLNCIEIYNKRDFLLNRLFYICMLFMNFLCLFIGYPLVNIAYILFILPGGIINLNVSNTIKE